MNALNEINKVLSSVSYYAHQHGNSEEEWLTAEQMAVSSIFLYNRNTLAYLFIYLFIVFRAGISEDSLCSSLPVNLGSNDQTWQQTQSVYYFYHKTKI